MKMIKYISDEEIIRELIKKFKASCDMMVCHCETGYTCNTCKNYELIDMAKKLLITKIKYEDEKLILTA